MAHRLMSFASTELQPDQGGHDVDQSRHSNVVDACAAGHAELGEVAQARQLTDGRVAVEELQAAQPPQRCQRGATCLARLQRHIPSCACQYFHRILYFTLGTQVSPY